MDLLKYRPDAIVQKLPVFGASREPARRALDDEGPVEVKSRHFLGRSDGLPVYAMIA